MQHRCGRTVSGSQVITVADRTAPKITATANVQIECGSDTSPNGPAGKPTATDTCGSVKLTYSDSVTTKNKCGNTKKITRTWYGGGREWVYAATARKLTGEVMFDYCR